MYNPVKNVERGLDAIAPGKTLFLSASIRVHLRLTLLRGAFQYGSSSRQYWNLLEKSRVFAVIGEERYGFVRNELERKNDYFLGTKSPRNDQNRFAQAASAVSVRSPPPQTEQVRSGRSAMPALRRQEGTNGQAAIAPDLGLFHCRSIPTHLLLLQFIMPNSPPLKRPEKAHIFAVPHFFMAPPLLLCVLLANRVSALIGAYLSFISAMFPAPPLFSHA